MVDTKIPSNAKKVPSALRERAPIIAGVLGIAVVGIAVGRASVTPGAAASPPPVTSSSASHAPASSATAQVFDTIDTNVAHGGVTLRDMDRDIFAEITAATLERERMKDVFPERPYRVQLIGSLTERRIGFVLVDLDRDGKNEEKWEIRSGEVNRTVFNDPATNGQPTKYNLRHGRWQVH
jgi:hypothetical protein